MKKLFVIIAIVAFAGTLLTSAITANANEEITVYNNPIENVLQSADQGIQPADTTKPECTKHADGEKKCSPDCKKACCAKKEECKKKAE